MRFFLITLTLVSFSSFAKTEARCELTNGIYINSKANLQEMNFETVADIFTINNARALNLMIDGEKMRFLRSDLSVGKLTKMIYLQKNKNQVTRAVHLMIDRAPKKVASTREFYGNMIISQEIEGEFDLMKINSSKNLVYNFYCSF